MTTWNALASRQTLLRTTLEQLAQAAPSEDGKPAETLSLLHDDAFEQGYVGALVDLLAWLGALETDSQGTQANVSSVQAGYLLRLMSSLLESDTTLVSDWLREGLTKLDKLDHPFGAAVDLLAVLERRRLEQDQAPKALRETQAALGLVLRRDLSGTRSYLLAKDEASDAWQFLGGRFELQDDTLRKTLLRELAEELQCEPLAEPDDLMLTKLGLPITETRLSPTYGLLTSTTFQLYAVHFVKDLARLHVGLRWVSEAELLSGFTSDYQRVDAQVLHRLLEQPGIDLDALLAEQALLLK